MDTRFSDSDMLNFLAENGRIKIAQIQQDMMNEERTKLLASHPYAVTQGKDGYYRTYVPDSTKKSGRRQLKKKHLEDLENEIIKSIRKAEAVTIEDIFEEYISRKRKKTDDDKEGKNKEGKKNNGIKPSTEMRYRNVFARHYSSTGWAKRDIAGISAEEFSDWLGDEIIRCDLDSKALAGLKLITGEIIRRGLKRHLINYPASMVFEMIEQKAYKKCKDSRSQIVTPKELSAFIRYVEENQTVFNLSLLFMAVSGLRVGEMTTLKFSDFVSATSFYVNRTETFYKANGKYCYEVSDRPKTAAGFRQAFIPQQYAWVVTKLRQIHPFAEYVCTDDNGERIRSYRLRNHLYGICRKLPEFKTEKSTHKLRKTFCSILLDSGFDNNLIISVMGHTDISTSEAFYHFDRKTAEQKQEMLNNVVEFNAV